MDLHSSAIPPDDQPRKFPAYLEALRRLGPPFPASALDEARKNREECTDLLLAEVQEILQIPDPFFERTEDRKLDDLYFVALPLLGEFREKRAFPLILELCRRLDVETLLGDLVTELLPAMLAGTCAGAIQPIQDLIVDEAVNEWVRSSAIRALGTLVCAGEWPEEQLRTYTGFLLDGGLEADPGDYWAVAAILAVDFQMVEQRLAIERAYERGLIDQQSVSLSELLEELSTATNPGKSRHPERYALIENTTERLRGWVKPQSNSGA